jgi:glycosyltransferase involved in cell wall biosynthesis
MEMLTIAIPTYNRNDILKRNLIYLIPQLTEFCQLVIVDNKSDISVHSEIDDLILKNPSKKINIIRNKHNVGLTGNIIKCFELCEDGWLWILGDDDLVKPNAISTIMNDINKNNDKVFISYAWDEPSIKRKGDITTRGVDEIIDSMESVGVILFISTSVYNVKKVSGSISYGSFFQSTYAPHLAILFMALKKGGECILTNKQIVTNNSNNTPLELRWDQIFIYQLILLLRLPLSAKTISKLKNRLSELTRLWTISHLIYTLTFLRKNEEEIAPIILYHDIVKSFYYLDNRMSTRIISIVGYLIIQYPKIFKPIMGVVYKKIKGKEFEPSGNLRI